MSVAAAIRRVLPLVLDGAERAPHPSVPRRLNGLFHRLRDERDALAAAETEDLIWAVWASHPDPEVEAALQRGVTALARRRFAEAEPLLDEVIAGAPDWAEPWNKRATLRFLMRRDAEALDDIAETLQREPRHFGAIAGYAEICLRNGALTEGTAALEMALRHNPHLHALRARLDGSGQPDAARN